LTENIRILAAKLRAALAQVSYLLRTLALRQTGVGLRIHSCRQKSIPALSFEVMKSGARTPNVRISPHSHELLRRLAEEEQDSMQSVLDKAIERYRRERFLRAANADFAALKRNAKAWKQELREREFWELTAADGLAKD